MESAPTGAMRFGGGRLMLLAAFSGFPRSGSTQDICHSVVSFMTGVLDEFVLLVILVEPEGPGPRSRPDARIVHGELILEYGGTQTSEPFGHGEVFARPTVAGSSVEVRRFHDEGVSVPVATHVAQP